MFGHFFLKLQKEWLEGVVAKYGQDAVRAAMAQAVEEKKGNHDLKMK